MEVKTKKLGEFAHVQGGFAFKSQEFTDSGIPVIKIKNVGTGSLNFSDYVFLKDEFAEEFSDYLTQSGDILISMTGSGPNQPGSLVGRVAYVKESDPICLINQRVGRLLFGKDPKIDPRFIFYILSSPQAREYLVSNSTGSANQANINGKTIENFLLPDIGFDMSCKIAEVLGSLDDKIELNRQMNQTLESIAQAIFQSWFVDFEPVKAKQKAKAAGKSAAEIEMAAIVALSGKSEMEIRKLGEGARSNLAEMAGLFSNELVESELGLIPERWVVGQISDLFELHRGFDLPKSQRDEGNYLVYSAGGIHGTNDEYKVKAPGIITGRSGVIGNVFISLKDFWPLNTTLYIREFRSCGPYYAFHFLKTLDLQVLNSGSAVPSLNRNFVHSHLTFTPPSILLDMFESQIEKMFLLIKENESQSQTLAQLRDALLPKLLSGELTLPAAQTQATEALVP